MYVLFGVSIVMFCGMFHYFLASKRPGVYPPRSVLKQRSAVLGLGGILFLLIGFIFRVFQ